MLSVKFDSPIIIDEKNLGALLTLAGVAARVEPYVEGAKPGRKPRTVEAPAPVVEAEVHTPVVEEVKKKPGRPPKVKEPEAAPEPAAAVEEAEVVDGASLLSRFSALIDKDFDSARSLLEEFGVGKFSDLGEADFAAFSNKMAELEGA